MEVSVKEIYKAVKNYLINEMGITKPSIEELVKENVKSHVQGYLETYKLKEIIVKEVVQLLSQGHFVAPELRTLRNIGLAQFVKDEVRAQVRMKLDESLDVQISYKGTEREAEILSEVQVTPRGYNTSLKKTYKESWVPEEPNGDFWKEILTDRKIVEVVTGIQGLQSLRLDNGDVMEISAEGKLLLTLRTNGL